MRGYNDAKFRLLAGYNRPDRRGLANSPTLGAVRWRTLGEAPARRQLAGGICTTPMCEDGKASVDQMLSVFHSLYSPDIFAPAVQAILDSSNETYSWYSDLIPFNPACCTMQAIGVQANAVTQQMSDWANVHNPGGNPSIQNPATGGGLATVLVGLGVLAAGIALFQPVLLSQLMRRRT